MNSVSVNLSSINLNVTVVYDLIASKNTEHHSPSFSWYIIIAFYLEERVLSEYLLLFNFK